MYSLKAARVEKPPRAQKVMSPVCTRTSPRGRATSCSRSCVSETSTTRTCDLNGAGRSPMGTIRSLPFVSTCKQHGASSTSATPAAISPVETSAAAARLHMERQPRQRLAGDRGHAVACGNSHPRALPSAPSRHSRRAVGRHIGRRCRAIPQPPGDIGICFVFCFVIKP
eukprot:scaffold25777_cov202-Isochrysis_galbana.AAC.2